MHKLQGNKLSLNVVKTQAMIIGSKPKINKLNNHSTLPSFRVVGELPYLGKSHLCGSKEDLHSNWSIEVCAKFYSK